MGLLHGSSAFQNLAEAAVSPWDKYFGGRGEKSKRALRNKVWLFRLLFKCGICGPHVMAKAGHMTKPH